MARVDEAKAKALTADALRKNNLRGFTVRGVARDEHQRITVFLTMQTGKFIAVFSGGEMRELHVDW